MSMKNLRELVSDRVNSLKGIQSEFKVFTISTTSENSEISYITPIRSDSDLTITGCVVRSSSDLLNIIDIVDGKFDLIVVDAEKKFPIRKSSVSLDITSERIALSDIDTGNIAKLSKHHFKRTRVELFKPNDLTVESVWRLLLSRKNLLSGLKICIWGAGNIGSKLALKLVESGSEIRIHKRNQYEGETIARALNIIKPTGTMSQVIYEHDPFHAIYMADVLLCTSNKKHVLTEEHIALMSSNNPVVIDVGKQNLTKDAIRFLATKKVDLVRADVTPSLVSYIKSILLNVDFFNSLIGRIEINNIGLVSGGYIGLYGDLIVDNYKDPKFVYGICDGLGGIKAKLSDSDKKNILYIEKLK